MTREQVRDIVLRSLNRYWGGRDIPAFARPASPWGREETRRRWAEAWELVLADSGRWYRSEDLLSCERCERLGDDVREVGNLRRNRAFTEYWCSFCSTDYASACLDCGNRFADEMLEEVSEGVICPECRDAREPEEEEEEEFLPSYHAGHRPSPPSKKSPAYSVELELESTERDRLIGKLQRLREGGLEVGWERDGSLDDRRGIEVLVSCYPSLQTVAGAVGEVIASSRGLGCVSWDSGRCGLHVNSNRWLRHARGRWESGDGPNPRAGWTRARVARLLYLVRSCWAELVQIAGRESAQWAALPQGWDNKPLKLWKWVDGEAGKYAAVRVGADRLEWRLFRGSLSPSRVALYLATVSALEGIALGDTPSGQIKEEARRRLRKLWVGQGVAKEQGGESVRTAFEVLQSVGGLA